MRVIKSIKLIYLQEHVYSVIAAFSVHCNKATNVLLREKPTALTEYNEPLVRRLIEKVTVYRSNKVTADKFTVEFKSGVTVDVDE